MRAFLIEIDFEDEEGTKRCFAEFDSMTNIPAQRHDTHLPGGLLSITSTVQGRTSRVSNAMDSGRTRLLQSD
jgi:hypothetical protein